MSTTKISPICQPQKKGDEALTTGLKTSSEGWVGTVEDIGEGVTVVLGDGIEIVPEEGVTFVLGDGIEIVPEEGVTFVLGDGVEIVPEENFGVGRVAVEGAMVAGFCFVLQKPYRTITIIAPTNAPIFNQ
jgi:hypothetical protein